MASGTTDVSQALAKVPSAPDAERAGSLAVAAPRITGNELDILKTALENPPEKADWVTTATTCLSGSFFAVKTLIGSATLDRGEVIAVAFAAGVVAVAIWRFVVQRTKKHPFHDLALTYVRTLTGPKSGS